MRRFGSSSSEFRLAVVCVVPFRPRCQWFSMVRSARSSGPGDFVRCGSAQGILEHKYPDIAVLRKNRPWALIELKERRVLHVETANNDALKLMGICIDLSRTLKKRN